MEDPEFLLLDFVWAHLSQQLCRELHHVLHEEPHCPSGCCWDTGQSARVEAKVDAFGSRKTWSSFLDPCQSSRQKIYLFKCRNNSFCYRWSDCLPSVEHAEGCVHIFCSHLMMEKKKKSWLKAEKEVALVWVIIPSKKYTAILWVQIILWHNLFFRKRIINKVLSLESVLGSDFLGCINKLAGLRNQN